MIGKKLSERVAQREGRRFASFEAAVEHLLTLPPNAFHLLVEHGPRCSRVRCVCAPSFLVRPLTIDAMAEGAELEAEWLRETAS